MIITIASYVIIALSLMTFGAGAQNKTLNIYDFIVTSLIIVVSARAAGLI